MASVTIGEYTFCIDGGGSKTLLQAVDLEGRLVTLEKGGVAGLSVEAGASNINTVRKDGVRSVLQELFDGVTIGGKALREYLGRSRVIAGMAGVGIPQNKEAVASLFEEMGVRNLELFTDAELALKLLKGNGVVLISGTGSICFAEKDGAKFRVGGLGRILGDEGSGYQIGLQALKAALEEEFGYGDKTALTPALREYFGVEEVKSLFPKINSLDMPAAEIAGASRFVFEKAAEGDRVAAEIIYAAANELRKLVATALKISGLAQCELHLYGGVFKGRFANALIDPLREAAGGVGIQVVNQAEENAAVLYARLFR